MSDLLTALKKYCADLGADAEVLPDAEAKSRLPLFLGQIYDPFRAKLFGREMRLMLKKGRKNPTPVEVDAHAKVLTKQLGPDVAFVFDQLPSFVRNRLLKRRIPFIVPQRQMFLPGGMIDLREVHGNPASEKTRGEFSMPAQLLLLHHLQKRAGHVPLALYEWAEALRYSRMSITRAYRELLDAGLVEPASPGKTVLIRFVEEGRELWERALPLLSSPVQKEDHFLVRITLPGVLEAGLTALARYTDLAEGPYRTLARWRRAPARPTLAELVLYRDTGTVLIQRWWYPPNILTEDHRTVDRLSLYLSLRQHADEKIQSALVHLLEGVRW
jgi:DNA-binding MarR family transcriptional regulator